VSDPNDYAAKIAALEEAKRQVEELIATLPGSQEKKILQGGWRQTAISNIPEGTSIPMGSALPGGSPVINGLLWTPAKVIGPALTAYHKALQAARHAFHAKAAGGEAVNPPEP
jgi:hypothetical protein